MDYTLQLSREKFAKQEPPRMAEQSGCHFSPATESFTVPFLGRTYTVSYPDGSATDTKQPTQSNSKPTPLPPFCCCIT
jgi:hypothetical protein